LIDATSWMFSSSSVCTSCCCCWAATENEKCELDFEWWVERKREGLGVGKKDWVVAMEKAKDFMSMPEWEGGTKLVEGNAHTLILFLLVQCQTKG